MPPLYPLKFRPLLKERVWGGRNLDRLYGKELPGPGPVGESWEICDRPEDVSVVADGPLAGRDLHSLVHTSAAELLGRSQLQGDRFPLLVKILDAQEKLSLQVHPPSDRAASLGGEPKTEMWHIAHAEPGAELYAGLRRGTTRGEFEERLRTGTVEQCVHRMKVGIGDTMFLPSGRVHAIGAGLVIFEIQQNSDTTFRVFDWNRVGLDSKPRQLHIKESLASIDFNDFEPGLSVREIFPGRPERYRLVANPLFSVDKFRLNGGEEFRTEGGRMRILGVVHGTVQLEGRFDPVFVSAGQFSLLAAGLEQVSINASSAAEFLLVETAEG